MLANVVAGSVVLSDASSQTQTDILRAESADSPFISNTFSADGGKLAAGRNGPQVQNLLESHAVLLRHQNAQELKKVIARTGQGGHLASRQHTTGNCGSASQILQRLPAGILADRHVSNILSAILCSSDIGIESNRGCCAGKYIAGLCEVGGGQSRLSVWDWKAGREVAHKPVLLKPKRLIWSDSTTLVTAGHGHFQVRISYSTSI